MIDILIKNKVPTILLVLDLFASIEKLIQGDKWGAIYWASAALLTASIMFGRQ